MIKIIHGVSVGDLSSSLLDFELNTLQEGANEEQTRVSIFKYLKTIYK